MILLIDNGSSKTFKIREIIIKSYKVITISYTELNTFDLSSIRGIILSGAPILLSDEKNLHLVAKFDALKNIDIPVLGICFGHQILSLLHGGYVRIQNDDRSLNEIFILKDSIIFNGLKNSFFMHEDHCEYASLPENFDLLANSLLCENEAMKHKELPFYGVQFHPEVSGDVGELLLNNFLAICN